MIRSAKSLQSADIDLMHTKAMQLRPKASELTIDVGRVADLVDCGPVGRWQSSLDDAIAEAGDLCELGARVAPVTAGIFARLFSRATPVAPIARSGQCAAFVVSIGQHVEARAHAYLDKGHYLEGVLLDAAGSVMAEALCDWLEQQWNGKPASTRFSPGYCHWDMQDQQILYETAGGHLLGVQLLSSMLLKPLKSVAGLIVAGDRSKLRVPGSTCKACTAPGCTRRLLE